MADYHAFGGYGDQIGTNQQPRGTAIQIFISVALGLGAFLGFCILRPKWAVLYAARKQQKDGARSLPELPSSMFGWIPVVWKITEQQVLASAGLDAFVFLAFFRMASTFLAVTLFFALVVIKPVHDRFPDDESRLHGNRTHNETFTSDQRVLLSVQRDITAMQSGDQSFMNRAPDYLWMYLVFAYIFTALALWLMIRYTNRIVDVRQEYLGSQCTITDRTIRLSGIPPELQSEERIKKFVETLEIGKVESVTLCRNWKELDDLMAKRIVALRRLEEAWTVYLGQNQVERNLASLPISQPPPPEPLVEDVNENDETEHLIGNERYPSRTTPYARKRPQTRIWYGFWKLRSKEVDAVDYYEEQLRKLDDKIKALRKEDFKPTRLAFVTMDSVAACQMAVQAVLDPSPLRLQAKLSPAPSDVVWQNTYLSRRNRMIRAWSITLIITILTVFWSIVLVPVAGALNLESIRKVFPQLADALESHPYARSFVQIQLPTLVTSLLNVLVPYFYDWLANQQGMISQGEVERSVISKNFFFTFFNFFIIFTVLGTASNFYEFFNNVGDSLKDTSKIAYTLALSLQRLLAFYANYIILQGVGLFPFRLLEFGSMVLYPIGLIGAKTPRDYAELVQPPIFSYGFYLPQTLLIFVICIVYSVFRSSWIVLSAGLVYFVLGRFVYKYQLLYAMDHRQHSTGRGWMIICYRVIVGLLLFQFATAGQMALKGAIKRSLMLIPLLLATIWFNHVFTRTYKPLMKFIALRSIERRAPNDQGDAASDDLDSNPWRSRYDSETDHGRTVDESRESGLRFINPSLTTPLEDVWIADKGARHTSNEQGETPDDASDSNV